MVSIGYKAACCKISTTTGKEVKVRKGIRTWSFQVTSDRRHDFHKQFFPIALMTPLPVTSQRIELTFFLSLFIKSSQVNGADVDQDAILQKLHVDTLYHPRKDYDFVQEIGEGTYGKVHLAKHKEIQVLIIATPQSN